MNNNVGSQDVALTVFGGAVPEMAPEDLPEGGSPQLQDVDFSPGRVFTRGGAVGQYTFAGLFAEKLAGFAQTFGGAHSPNEIAWANPTNATLNTPGTYTSVTLNTGGSAPFPGVPQVDQVSEVLVNPSFGSTLTMTSNALAGANELAVFFGSWANQPNQLLPNGFSTLTSAGNASAGKTIYNGVLSPVPSVGSQMYITGFTHAANNGIFIVQTGTNGTTLILNNPSGVAEIHAGVASPWIANIATPGGVGILTQLQPTTAPVSIAVPEQTGTNYAVAILALFGTTGGIPTFIQTISTSAALNIGTFLNPISAGSGILVFSTIQLIDAADCNVSSVHDQYGNVYNLIGNLKGPYSVTPPFSTGVWMYYCSNPAVGQTPDISVVLTNNDGISYLLSWASEVSNITIVSGVGFPYSQILQSNNFAFNIPTTESVLGVQAEVSGHQTTLSPDAILTAQLVTPAGVLSPKTLAFQLPLADAQAVEGVTSFTWALSLTPAMLNNPNFSVNLVAQALGGEVVMFDIYAVKLKAWLSPAPAANFNWIKTYEQTDGEIDTLALDANGLLWDETVTTTPGVFNNISTAIQPGSYAKSVTFDDVEYIGISNLINGTDVPRLWNEEWLDRVSQVGPGAPPSVALTASGSTIVSITQNAPTTLGTGPHDWLLVSASPSSTGTFGAPATPGNIMTIITRAAFVPPTSGTPPTPIFKVGTNIQILGFPTINGNVVNNDPTGATNPAYYTVLSVGATIAGQQSYDWITFQVPFTTFYNQLTPGGCTIQSTLSTLTAAQQVPFLEVGNQFTVAGASSAGYDNTFVVTATPNAAQLSISQTSLTANVATFVFTLITGTLPTIGEFVTVTGTLNGNGIFNVTNAVITAASPTSFSVALINANVSPAPETGNGIISGTIFQFDPAGTVTNPIIANSTGGTISTSGVLGTGTRQCVVIFETRNGALTAPSPYVQFNITANSTAIVVSNIPIGPPNVTARILAFTGANGGNFFYIPIPVAVTTNGQLTTYPATVINDNVTTQVTLSFPDAVLLAASAIDVQGNNLFEQEELGSSVGFLSYSDRLIAWQEQNKVQNFLNLSFDGGLGILSSAIQNTTVTYPLGWTVDPVNGGGISLLVSPIFGNSFYIHNVSGGTEAIYGMIEQPAYQDQFQVPIITTNTLYSIRVTARCPSGVTSGNLVMDLFSPKLNQVFGSFTVPLASMTTVMQIFTGTLLTTAFTTVPKDLIFRVYTTNLPNGGDVELDRVEPFPTLEPSFSTEFTASYADNPEAFDLVTGHFGPSQNQQPIRGGMVLFDTLYALKTHSWYSTSDTGNSEPAFWNWREVSNKIGTIGSHSFDYGEDYAFTACRPGVYFFSGGEPLKVSQEISPVWDLVNWPAAQSIWLRNDPEQRKLYVGVPIATPNFYMPQFPINTNPQTPNVILVMNYRELNSGIAIADTPPIRSSFSGRLLAPEPARKWSFWNIASPYADFIDRGNNQTPLFLCNGVANSKIYTLLSSELDDDGLPINGYYFTYGFVKADMQDAKGLGLRRMLLAYLSILAEGNGNLNVSVYVQSPQNLPFLLSSIPLSQFTLGDLEAVVNCEGERFFLCVGTNAVGSNFSMSKVVVSLMKSAWSPIRGLATANP